MPSITIWNRIEPRCRAADLESGLEARAHDPLWLLARQWQVGEFEGRDSGSPVSAQLEWTSAPFDRTAIGPGAGQPYDNRLPIETLIEREPVRPVRAQDDLRQAAEAGLHFVRLLNAAKLGHVCPLYLEQYPLTELSSQDADTRNFFAVMAGRAMDGIKLYADLKQAGSQLPTAPAVAASDHQAVLAVTRVWMSWYASLFSEQSGSDAWSPDRMEYQFATGSAADSGSFQAKEYDGGTVDWYTFDRSPSALTGGSRQPTKNTRLGLISPVTFRGMPARRFWEMEDASVDIGALSAGAEDLGRLLLRDFALIYGNDWFQIPLAVPVGTDVTINTLSVVDTFGLILSIPHYAEVDGTTGLWRMFALSNDSQTSDVASAQHLLTLPSAVGVLESSAIEDVLLLRDELADMAWGVERIAMGPAGIVIDRTEVWRTSAPPVLPPSATALPKYRLGSTVPDYWIPFLPTGTDNAHLQLKRGILPTAAGGPMGRLLSYPDLTMFLDELPREGVHLERRFCSARGTDGSSLLWIGRRRSTGSGEGRSGLKFDYLEFS
jgi:hypothetical protein